MISLILYRILGREEAINVCGKLMDTQITTKSVKALAIGGDIARDTDGTSTTSMRGKGCGTLRSGEGESGEE
jgi:hypothetical protein